MGKVSYRGRFCLLRALVFAACSLVILVFARPALAVIQLDDTPRFIGEELEEWVDESGAATANDALAVGRLRPARAARPNHGYSRAAYFYRFTVENLSPQPRAFVLDAAREWVTFVELYRVEDGAATLAARAGASIPRARRDVPVERQALPLELAPHERRTYLLRLAGDAPISLFGEISPKALFFDDYTQGELVWGVFFGALLGVALYCGIVFVVLRDPQWPLALVILGVALFEAAAHGHLARAMPVFVPALELRGCALGFVLFSGALPTWTRVVLRTRAAPRLDRGLRALATYAAFASAVGGVFLPLNAVIFLAPLPLALGVTLVGVLRWRAGHAPALPYLIAVGVFLVPGAIVLLTLLGTLPLYPFTEHSHHVGAVVMAVLFALIASQEMRVTRTELASTSRALEKRMQDLEAKNREVTSLADDLRDQIVLRSGELARALEGRPSTPVLAPLEPGELFERRYRVVRRLGAGGMGAVYEVVRERDKRRFALKVLTSATNAASVVRLAREAELGAKLNHPNLVNIVDVGLRDTQTPFLVMDLVEGGSLEEQRARFGEVPWALDVLRGIAAGLAALHGAGVIHRDLKPSNVLLDQGRVRICDFGIAKQAEPGSEGETTPLAATLEARVSSARLTATGAVLGTPMYMAPEAFTRASLGPSADIFAFGLVSFELLTGSFPLALFAAASLGPAFAGSLPSLDDAPGLPSGLATLLTKCVAMHPAERPSAAEIVAALGGAVSL